MKRAFTIASMFVLMGGLATESSARPGPRRGQRTPADTKQPRKDPRAVFSGTRTRRPVRLPAWQRAEPRAAAAAADPFDRPTDVGQVHGIEPRAGVGSPTLGPAVPVVPPTGPMEFAFVSPIDLGNPAQPVRLVEGTMLRWEPGKVEMPRAETLTFAVQRPPPGKVAEVRCALWVEDYESPPIDPKIRVTVGNATTEHTLTKSPFEGLVSFQVFPGTGDEKVTIGLDEVFSTSDDFNFTDWHLFGCERRVD